MESWIILTDEHRVGGMLAAARQAGATVTAAVVGPRILAEAVAAAGPDRVLWFALPEGMPAEACAARLAEQAGAASPRLVLASDAPAGRILLGMVAARLGAAVVSSVRKLALDGDRILVDRPTAEGRAVATFEAMGGLAGIFDGDDVEEAATASAVAIEEAPAVDPGGPLRVVATETAGAESAGLLTAARVVGAGLGIKARPTCS